MGANGFGDHSPGQYNLFAGLLIEIVLTAVFLVVIMGATDKRASKGFPALAIGLVSRSSISSASRSPTRR